MANEPRTYAVVAVDRPATLVDSGVYIGAHAAVRKYRLLTRDVARYRTYFPSVELVAP